MTIFIFKVKITVVLNLKKNILKKVKVVLNYFYKEKYECYIYVKEKLKISINLRSFQLK